MSELTPLKQGAGGQETAIISGNEVLLDDATWHYVMVFPMVYKDKNGKETFDAGDPSEIIKNTEKEARKLFKNRVWNDDKVKDKFTKDMTRLQFHETVRAEIARVLAGPKCAFKMATEYSVDEDELLLKIEVTDSRVAAIADRQEVRMPVRPDAYPKVDANGQAVASASDAVEDGCPTLKYAGGRFTAPSKDDPRNKCVPLYMRYDKDHPKLFADFREVDKIRMIRKRLNEFFTLPELERSKVMTKMFPVHHYKQKAYFEGINWSKLSFCSWLEIPWGEDIDDVRDYFGEEVAFFFHWMTFYTRWMFIPGLLGAPLFLRRYLMPLDQQRLVQIGFCMVMIGWSALFTSYYTQRAQLKMLQWGMQNYSSVASVRRQFRKEKRGTKVESIQMMMHWVLAVIFMVETIAAVAAINSFRSQASKLEADEAIMGIPAAMAVKLGKYLITANIKFVDIMWAKLSPFLTKKENWRTYQEEKDNAVLKLFAVKFVVYYYPFYYIAFIKEHVEGCEEGGDRGCLPMLVENLVIFFFTHVATTAANLVVPMVLTRIAVSSEIKKAKVEKPAVQYTYLQQQAKCPEYVSDTQDFMDLVLALGFVMMFSVALPVMAFLSLVSNMIELKFLAFRMMNVQQRSEPIGQEGIGAWEEIIKFVSRIAVIANAGMACFVMHPIKDLPLWQKLGVFIIVEHVAYGLMFVIQGGIPTKGFKQKVIEERNDDLADEVAGDQNSKVNFDPFEKEPNLKCKK